MKKLLAICLSVLLLCAAIPFCFATADEVAAIVVSDVEGKAGEEVSVTISMKNNPGIVSAKVGVGYDADALELISSENGDFFAAGYSYGPIANNPYIINWMYAIGTDSTAELLATLKFKIKDGAAAGTYPVTLTFSCEDDMYNLNWDTVEFAADEGSVTVVADEPTPDVPVYTEPTIVVSDAEGEAGDAISVTVSMKNNPGIVSAKVGVGYDASVLELVSSENGDFFAAGYSYGPIANNPYIINWMYAIGTDSTAELLATLNFKIKDGAAAGTYPLTLIFSCEDDMYNLNWDTIEFGADEGVVTIIGDEPVAPPACEHEYDAACDPECNLCGEIRDVHTEGIIHFDAVEAACHYNGNIEYWFCPECECFWADEALTQLTNSKNVIVPAIGGEVIHFDAIEPACHYDGQIEYWFCADCEQFWQDEALTQLTNSKNVVLPAIGSENLQHVEAVAPTCQSEGNIEYWYCSDCEQFWADEALTQLTNSKNVILGVADHNVVHFDAVEPGCHYIGNIEYWFCTECELFWADEALTQITNSKSVILPAIGGETIHFDAIEPACHYNGQIEYWFCPECEQFWQDEALTQYTNSKNVVLPAIGSENLQHVEAVAPTCQSEGNIEYWFCSDCEQFWADEALTQLTNSKNVILGVADHNIVHMDAVEPGCHYIGNIEYWYCTECELFWADEALTQITNSKSVILPAIGGETIHFDAIEPACHYNGQIEYWFCAECEQYWQDEALTQLTNSHNVILPAIGGEVKHVEAKEPTATENGNIEYWYCEECEQFWADEALTQITNSKNVILAATGTQSPETGDSTVAVVIALLTLVASGAAVVLLKNKKHA